MVLCGAMGCYEALRWSHVDPSRIWNGTCSMMSAGGSGRLL